MKWPNNWKKYGIVGAFVFVFLAGAMGWYTAYDYYNMRNEAVYDYADATAENESLKRKIATLEGQLSDSGTQNEFLANLGVYFAGQVDELNSILLETDSNSVDMINWMSDNALFYGSDQIEATKRYTRWQLIQQKTTEDYHKAIGDLRDTMNKIDQYVNQPSSISNDLL